MKPSMRIIFCLILVLVLTKCQNKTVTIIGSNDIHGKAFSTVLFDTKTNQNYNYGGLVYMATIIKILEQQNPNILYLDAGDQFQGGIQASDKISSGGIMNQFYNAMGVAANAIGNHQFDFGPSFLLPYLSKKQNPVLAANLRSQKGQMNFVPKQKSSVMYELQNGVKIGVIGLSTLQTPSSTSGFNQGGFPQYKFLQYKPLIQAQSKKLRRSGCDIVLLVSHVGDYCQNDFTYNQKITINTQQLPCQQDDEMSMLLKSLEKGILDGVVQGHRHRTAHHYVNGIPYIGNINGGYYINTINFILNQNDQIIDSYIQGPIPVCQKIFKNRGRCDYVPPQQRQQAGQLQDFYFHNRKVIADQQLSQIYQKYSQQMKPYFKELVNNQLYLKRVQTQQSQLGNLLTDLVATQVQCDFAILNPGGFRSQWIPGIIQYQHFYNMFPFKNYIVTFKIYGSQLLYLLEKIQSGQKGFYQLHNLTTKVTYNQSTNKKGFISASFLNGIQIDPQAQYKGATLDFLVKGGDDFSKVVNDINFRELIQIGQFKQVVQPALQNLITIKGPLIDPNNPRIDLVKI